MVKIRQAIVVEGRYDKNTLAQIVDVILQHPVVVGGVARVSPDPAHGNAGVVEIRNLRAGDLAVMGVHDQHTAGGEVALPQLGEAAAGDGVVVTFHGRIAAEGDAVHADTAHTAAQDYRILDAAV